MKRYLPVICVLQQMEERWKYVSKYQRQLTLPNKSAFAIKQYVNENWRSLLLHRFKIVLIACTCMHMRISDMVIMMTVPTK